MLAKLFQVAFAGWLLAGCAMTPQQRAAYEAAREREMKQTAVALAAQCDQRTAELLALQQEDYLGWQMPRNLSCSVNTGGGLRSRLFRLVIGWLGRIWCIGSSWKCWSGASGGVSWSG